MRRGALRCGYTATTLRLHCDCIALQYATIQTHYTPRHATPRTPRKRIQIHVHKFMHTSDTRAHSDSHSNHTAITQPSHSPHTAHSTSSTQRQQHTHSHYTAASSTGSMQRAVACSGSSSASTTYMYIHIHIHIHSFSVAFSQHRTHNTLNHSVYIIQVHARLIDRACSADAAYVCNSGWCVVCECEERSNCW